MLKGSKTFILNYRPISQIGIADKDKPIISFWVTALLSEEEAARTNIFVKFVNTPKEGSGIRKVGLKYQINL
jgi:hypothetical protein